MKEAQERNKNPSTSSLAVDLSQLGFVEETTCPPPGGAHFSTTHKGPERS